jgi:hypothetical protein
MNQGGLLFVIQKLLFGIIDKMVALFISILPSGQNGCSFFQQF